MKTITINGDPKSLSVIMVSKTIEYKDHEIIRIESADTKEHAEKLFSGW